MVKKEYVSWEDFENLCQELAKRIKNSGKQIKRVYGIPRGGLPIAVRLSHILDIDLTLDPYMAELIVDDVSDTGGTIPRFFHKGQIVACFHIKKNTEHVPDIWIKEIERDTWIVYPWEESEEPDRKDY